jgi:tRNA (guanine-N7-)-methyltransferase
MKPEDLKHPFRWEERHILFRDRILYIPPQYEDYQSFTFPGWGRTELFSNENPVCIEYCSGNGAWITAKAQHYPQVNWVAVEQKFERVRKIWSKMKNLNLNNLMIICGEGLRATRHYIPDLSVKSVYINFPDPWPKKKHAKNRIIQPSFIEQLHRILEKDGSLILVTDDEPYSDEIIQLFHDYFGFHSELPSPYFTTDYPEYGTSYFEELWRSRGKFIRYHRYRKSI